MKKEEWILRMCAHEGPSPSIRLWIGADIETERRVDRGLEGGSVWSAQSQHEAKRIQSELLET